LQDQSLLLGTTPLRYAYDLVGSNYSRLRDVLYLDLDKYANYDRLTVTHIFCLFVLETFVRPGQDFVDCGLVTLKKRDIHLETINDEYVINFNFFGKFGCYTAKRIITTNKSLFDKCNYFKTVNNESPYFFSHNKRADKYSLLSIILPGTTYIQLRRSGCSLLGWKFLWDNRDNIKGMEKRNCEKFNTIINDLNINPSLLVTRAFKHLQLALDHKCVMTTIVYIDPILIYWLFNCFFKNHCATIEALKNLMLRVRDNSNEVDMLEELDDIDDIQNVIDDDDKLSCNRFKWNTELEQMCYFKSKDAANYLYGNNSKICHGLDYATRVNYEGIAFFKN
jgi:hypothetical protein